MDLIVSISCLGGIFLSFITIFNASIPVIWLATIISFLLSSFIIKIITKQKVSDSFSNGFFLYIIIWKLSYILFSYEHFITMPLSIIYFHGGKYGHLLALLIVAIYFYRKKNDTYTTRQIREFTLSFIIMYEILLSAFHFEIIATILHLIVYIIFITIKWKQRSEPLQIQSFIIIFFIELTVISLFETLLTIKALTFTIIVFLSMLVTYERGGVKLE